MLVSSVNDAADFIFKNLGPTIRLATPLGLGKPNELLNLIYKKVREDSSLSLDLFTALSLTTPSPRPRLAQRFFNPFKERYWGKNYPELCYAQDAIKNRLPENVKVTEFYFNAGSALNSNSLQQHYRSINYTHVAEAIFKSKVNVLVQLVSKKSEAGKVQYSLSSNPDLTCDVVDLYRKHAVPILIVGVVHPDLPYLRGDAEVDPDFFNVIVDNPQTHYELFGVPPMPISAEDHRIGFYASQLVKDGGTLQIGIGSLSEAIVASLIVRQKQNAFYQSLVAQSWAHREPPADLHHEIFDHGLYGLSEMVMDGFMHLRRAGILKREIIDDKTGINTYLHGAFFLGSKTFYAWLRNLSESDRNGIRMSRVSKVNDLYDPHEMTLRKQRKHPRFFNTCMQVTLLGGAMSETLENGHVVSGVGGQYNFVSMAHELEDGKSILLLRSTRTVKGKRISNIVWSAGHLTIPRHLKDIVVTEYGIADLRGKSDEDTISELLNITDTEFQPALLRQAKKFGKIKSSYEIPVGARNNHPAKVRSFVAEGNRQNIFRPFPLGSDFDPTEERLLRALTGIRKTDLLRGFSVDSTSFAPELSRMELGHPVGIRERLEQKLLLGSLDRLRGT
jgi:acyl-CoA hydrolase